MLSDDALCSSAYDHNAAVDFVKELPGGIVAAFSYGSAVFSQPSASPVNAPKDGAQSSMIDIILIVRNAVDWHEQNLLRNRNHYGPLAFLGPSAVQCNAATIGVGFHFNPYVRRDGRLVKYGVISLRDALRDLWSWDSLYLAGRLHKPTRQIVQSSCQCLESAMLWNCRAAAAAAVLLLPAQVSEQEVLAKIVSLSYSGDVRMGLAEDANKVRRIADGSGAALRQMYTPALLRQAVPGLQSAPGAMLRRPGSPAAEASLAARLPPGCLARACKHQGIAAPRSPAWGLGPSAPGDTCRGCSGPGARAPAADPSVAEALCRMAPAAQWLPRALEAAVRRSSRRQALAGLLATSPGKSVAYVGAKLWKRAASVA